MIDRRVVVVLIVSVVLVVVIIIHGGQWLQGWKVWAYKHLVLGWSRSITGRWRDE